LITLLLIFCSKGDGKGVRVPSPHTPKAPRHGPRPPSRLKVSEMRQVAAVLFPESAFPSRCLVPSVIPRPLYKSLASNRVLFYEDELCQAVAQNKLRWCNCVFNFILLTASYSCPLLCIFSFGLYSQVNFRIVEMQFCSLSCGSVGGVDISYMSK